MPISETYNIDCMEYMKTLPDNAFDLAVADPPYGGGFTEGGGCKGWFSKYHQDREEKPKRELGAHFVARGRSKRYAEIYEQDEACSQIGNVERESKGSRGITASEAPEADLNATSENRTEKQRKKS